jgi:hypothetical protein
MRTAKLGKLLAAGLLGLAVPAAAFADPGSAPPPPPGSTSIFSQMLRGRPPSATVTDTAKEKDKKTPPKPSRDPIAKLRDQELANWLRRTDVCLKLMEVADQTGDENLRKKAQELDRRARAAYERRIAELGGEAGSEDGLDSDRLKDADSARSAGVLRRDRKKEGDSQ